MSGPTTGTSWIKDKAYAELARIREAKAKQVYPYFRPFDSGGSVFQPD